MQCYFEKREDGSVDRLKNWSRRHWSLRPGASPGFHEKAVNPYLEKFLPRLSEGLEPSVEGQPLSVLVPLCGKTFDMPYLCEQGCAVLGVEGVERAVLEFKNEHRMRVKGMKTRAIMSKQEDGSWSEGAAFFPSETFQGARPGQVFKKGSQGLGYYTERPGIWRGKVSQGKKGLPLEIIEGDMFEIRPELISAGSFNKEGKFDMVYDRGSLVAIPPEARPEYVSTISGLLRVGGRILLVGVDYEQQKVPYDPSGKRGCPPPFAITGDHVRQLFPAAYWKVTVLNDSPATMTNRAFTDVPVRNVTYLIEKRAETWGNGISGSSSAGMLMAGTALLAGAAACALLLRPGGSN